MLTKNNFDVEKIHLNNDIKEKIVAFKLTVPGGGVYMFNKALYSSIDQNDFHFMLSKQESTANYSSGWFISKISHLNDYKAIIEFEYNPVSYSRYNKVKNIRSNQQSNQGNVASIDYIKNTIRTWQLKQILTSKKKIRFNWKGYRSDLGYRGYLTGINTYNRIASFELPNHYKSFSYHKDQSVYLRYTMMSSKDGNLKPLSKVDEKAQMVLSLGDFLYKSKKSRTVFYDYNHRLFLSKIYFTKSNNKYPLKPITFSYLTSGGGAIPRFSQSQNKYGHNSQNPSLGLLKKIENNGLTEEVVYEDLTNSRFIAPSSYESSWNITFDRTKNKTSEFPLPKPNFKQFTLKAGESLKIYGSDFNSTIQNFSSIKGLVNLQLIQVSGGSRRIEPKSKSLDLQDFTKNGFLTSIRATENGIYNLRITIIPEYFSENSTSSSLYLKVVLPKREHFRTSILRVKEILSRHNNRIIDKVRYVYSKDGVDSGSSATKDFSGKFNTSKIDRAIRDLEFEKPNGRRYSNYDRVRNPNPIYTSTPFEYSYVEVIKGRDGKGGKQTFEFISPKHIKDLFNGYVYNKDTKTYNLDLTKNAKGDFERKGLYPYTESFAWARGHILESKTFQWIENDFVLKSKTMNNYKAFFGDYSRDLDFNDQEFIFNPTVLRFKPNDKYDKYAVPQVVMNENNKVSAKMVLNRPGYIQLSSTFSTVFPVSGKQGITSSQNNYYDNLGRVIRTESNTYGERKKSTKRLIFYPDIDLRNVIYKGKAVNQLLPSHVYKNPLETFKEKKMIYQPILTIDELDDELNSAEFVQYKNYSGIGLLPWKIFSKQLNNEFRLSTTVMSYDAYGNPQEMEDYFGRKTLNIYGYEGSQLVLSIDDVSLNAIDPVDIEILSNKTSDTPSVLSSLKKIYLKYPKNNKSAIVSIIDPVKNRLVRNFDFYGRSTISFINEFDEVYQHVYCKKWDCNKRDMILLENTEVFPKVSVIKQTTPINKYKRRVNNTILRP